MSRHKRALQVITAALVLDVACGLLFALAQRISPWLGMYCGLANAVTVGGSVSPSTVWGYIITAVECATVVPLFAATFSLFTSGLTAGHVERHTAAIKQHISEALACQPGEERRGG